MYTENIEILRQNLNLNKEKGTMKHNINRVAPLFPFQTREPERVKFERGMKGVLGELARDLCRKKAPERLETEQIIEKVISGVEVSQEDSSYLKEIIREYLISNDNEINIVHPHLFLYNMLTEGKQATGERAIAGFISDVLVGDNEKMQSFFGEKESDHIILKLILRNIPELDTVEKETKYINKLEFISQIMREDLEFLLDHEEYLIKNIELIMAYYYFFYVTQLSVKLNKNVNANLSECEEIYYLLDWEIASKNRKAVSTGYSYIKDNSKRLLMHVNGLEHINTILGERGLTLAEINDKVNTMQSDQKHEFIEAVQAWIMEYREFNKLEEKELSNDIITLTKCLEDSIYERIAQGTLGAISRYEKNIEEIGKKYFLKTRGRYGSVLNITQEMLLVLTAMCIKKEKITLTQLFQEYEKRGVYLDRYSVDEIITLFNKLNLIDKKSDSGDAQYVKSIL